MPSNEKLRQKKIESLQYAALILINILDKSIDKNAIEGIFRISGAKRLMDSKIDEIQKGKMDFGTLNQLEQAALLKTVIRELQNIGEPFISYEKFDNLKKAQEKIHETQPKLGEPFNEARREYDDLIYNLLNEGSDINKKIAFRLLVLLNKVSTKPTAKMPATNLAIVMTPNILKIPSEISLQNQALISLSMNGVCSDLIEKIGDIKKPEIYLQGTHYEAQTIDVSENRFHLFNASSDKLDAAYEGLKGDVLKSRILLNFKQRLEKATLENLDQEVDQIKTTSEYNVLAASQGLTTWVLSFFMQRDTSSVKAFREMVAERRSDLEFERTLEMK
ncbi:RhoGAP domain-containing protein [Fluoribacter gormanii]|uniref:RhoGAP domain-containing protein n=1 Tax=Fluoribacter gormanii TaxID=464 RepID=UPI0010419369|nr:RhoGAP domain-containing protein [Fluoribacter gormanii]